MLKLKTVATDRTTTVSILADIKSLACKFSYVSFVHVSRIANEVAHVLARSSDCAYSSFLAKIIHRALRRKKRYY